MKKRSAGTTSPKTNLKRTAQNIQPASGSPADSQRELVLPRQRVWRIGTVLLGDYRIVRHLGEGGMGAVYLVKRGSDGMFFAMKSIRAEYLYDSQFSRLFIREIRTWIDLPEHPHITACRFFRTIDDRMVVFLEYVDGGSLSRWIQDGKLTEFALVLDIAIQVVRALHATHRSGVVHHDIKPANILMTEDSVAKITDFGLAKVKCLSKEIRLAAKQHGQHYTSNASMTPAYCSPEQFGQSQVDHRTDIWSWGVSVLEMFNGGVTWLVGVLASGVLERLISDGPVHSNLGVPPAMIPVLRKCFHPDIDLRWQSCEELEQALLEVYQQEIGAVYPRRLPEHVIQSSPKSAKPHDRKSIFGSKWDDPMIFLESALKATGHDFSVMERYRQSQTGSRQSQALEDLGVIDEAIAIYRQLIVGLPDKSILRDFASALNTKVIIQMDLADHSGVVFTCDQMIEVNQTLCNNNPSATDRISLAHTFLIKASSYFIMNDHEKSIECSDNAIRELEKIMDPGEMEVVLSKLGTAHMNKAVSLHKLKELSLSEEYFDKALTFLNRMESPTIRHLIYMNKGILKMELGDVDAALDLYEQAIRYLKMESDLNDVQIQANLTMLYVNKGVIEASRGNYTQAQKMYEYAERLLCRMVYEEDLQEYSYNLSICYFNKSHVLLLLNCFRNALDAVDAAIGIMESLVVFQGRQEYESILPEMYAHKSKILNQKKEQ